MSVTQYMRPSMLAQNFPSAPKFTEANVPDLAGNVYIVTGANAGVGKELARLLLGKNAVVYMACRSEAKCKAAIDEITKTTPSTGRLEFLHLDLGDLTTVKPAAESFLARESKLNVLFNNAGVMLPPVTMTATTQGHDVQLGTNCVGPFLFTELLTPVLKATATPEVPARVVWVSSMATELYSETGGVDMANLVGKTYTKAPTDPMVLYGNSKAGNYLHSTEYARRHRADNIVSVAANPGNLDSDLYRTMHTKSPETNTETGANFTTKISMKVFTRFMLHPPVHGAYTELFAGLSPEVTMEKTGAWIGPWGRFFPMRKDIAAAAKPKSEGGSGGAEAFWNWTMDQVKAYM